MTANGVMIQPTLTRCAMWLTACTIPCSTLMSFFGIATRRVSVAPIYSAPETTPPQATAPGSVLRGSRISSPITDASSSPTSPKQITPKEFRTNLGFAGILKSAAVIVVPNRNQITAPNPISTAAAMKVPTAPRLLIHLPTPSPRMLKYVSNPSSMSDAVAANILLSDSPSWPGPSAYTDTPTKYSMTVGT